MKNIDWSKLSFSYTQTKALVYSRCIDGKWETPTVTENFNICLNSFAGIFHYAPSCFEGLKAFRGVDGRIRLFVRIKCQENGGQRDLSGHAVPFRGDVHQYVRSMREGEH